MADMEVIAAILTAGMQARLGEYKQNVEVKQKVRMATLRELIVQEYQDVLTELKKRLEKS